MVAALPMVVIGAEEGAALTDIRAFATLADGEQSPVLRLPPAVVEPPTVELALAPRSVPADELDFDLQVQMAQGRFTTLLSEAAGGNDDGQAVLWARACLGSHCGQARLAELQATG